MDIIVQPSSETDTTATLICGAARYKCTLGRSGVTIDKTEGDGKTPIGTYPLRQVFYRADRVEKPQTELDVFELTAQTGWCEDPACAAYNTQVVLPHAGQTDSMTRDDHLYDIVIVVGYNDAPPVAGKGSAIFVHLRRDDFSPTVGCVGLAWAELQEVLKNLDKSSRLIVLPPPVAESDS